MVSVVCATADCGTNRLPAAKAATTASTVLCMAFISPPPKFRDLFASRTASVSGVSRAATGRGLRQSGRQMKNRTLAFIGLGRMGRPMAARLAAAGYPLRVYDKARRVRLPGAIACDSPAEAASGATLLITMLPDGKAVRAALLGRNGAATALGRGSVVIDMSSSDPVATR